MWYSKASLESYPYKWPMRPLKSITGHMVYILAYNWILQMKETWPECIYNSHYGNGVPAIVIVLPSWKVNIAENPIAVMEL